MDGEVGGGGPQHFHYGQIQQHHQVQHPHHHEFQEPKQEEWNAYHHMQQQHQHQHHEEQLHLHQHHAAHHHLHQHPQMHLQHPHQPHMLHSMHSHHHHHQHPQMPPQQHQHRHMLPPGAEQLANGHIHHPVQPMTPQGSYQHHPQHVHPQPVHHLGALPVPAVDPPTPLSVGGPSTGSGYIPDPSSQHLVQHQQHQHAHPHHHQAPRSMVPNGHLQHSHQQQQAAAAAAVSAAAAAAAAVAATDHYLNASPHPLHDISLQQQQQQQQPQQQQQQQQFSNHHHHQPHQQSQQQQQPQAMGHGQLGGEGVQVQPPVAVPGPMPTAAEQQQQQQQQQLQGAAPPSLSQHAGHDVSQGAQPSPAQQQQSQQQAGQVPVPLPAMHLQSAVQEPAPGSLQAAVAAAAVLDGGTAARDGRQTGGPTQRGANPVGVVGGAPGMRASVGGVAAVVQAEGIWGDALLGPGTDTQPRSKRPRPTAWTPEEELHLVALYSSLSQKKHDSRKNLWDGVVAGLAALGYDRRLQSVVQRWSHLQATHRALAGYLAALPGGSPRFWGARAVDRKQIFQALKCAITLDQRVWEALNEVLKDEGAASGGPGGTRGAGGSLAGDDTAAGAPVDDGGARQPAHDVPQLQQLQQQQLQQQQLQQQQLLEAGMSVEPDMDDEVAEPAGTSADTQTAKRTRRDRDMAAGGGEQADGDPVAGLQARLEAAANEGMVLRVVGGSAGGPAPAHAHQDASAGAAGPLPAAPVTPAAAVGVIEGEGEADRAKLGSGTNDRVAGARQERQLQLQQPQQLPGDQQQQEQLQPTVLGGAPEELQQEASGTEAQPLSAPPVPPSLQQQQQHLQAIQALQQAQQAIQAQIKAAFTPLLSAGGGVGAPTRPLLPVPQLLTAAPLLAANPLLSTGPLLSALAAGTTAQQLGAGNPGMTPGSAATATLLGPGAAAAAAAAAATSGGTSIVQTSRTAATTGAVSAAGSCALPGIPSVQGLAALASATQAAAAAAAKRDAAAAAEAAAQAVLLDCDAGGEQLPGRALLSSITRNVVLKMAEADQMLGRTSAAETDRARGYLSLISDCLHLLPLIRKQEAQVQAQLSSRDRGTTGGDVPAAGLLPDQQERGRLGRGAGPGTGPGHAPLPEPFTMQPHAAVLALQASGERSLEVEATHSPGSEQPRQPQPPAQSPAAPAGQLVHQGSLGGLPQPQPHQHPATLLPEPRARGQGHGAHAADGADIELDPEQHAHQHGMLLPEGSQAPPRREPPPLTQPSGNHPAQQQQQ